MTLKVFICGQFTVGFINRRRTALEIFKSDVDAFGSIRKRPSSGDEFSSIRNVSRVCLEKQLPQ